MANIFGAIIGRIQEKMIAMDIRQIEGAGDTFFNAHDMAYLIFLMIGIVGYFSVPSVASQIIQAGGGNALMQKVTALFASSVAGVGGKAFPAGGGFGRYPSSPSKT